MEDSIGEIVRRCDPGWPGDFQGQFRPLQERLDRLARSLGQFVLADQKDFYAWEIDRYDNFTRDESPRFASRPLRGIEVHMARNEYRDAVFMVSSCGRDLRLDVKVEPRGVVPRDAILVEQALYLKNRRNQETGDVLAPLEGPLLVPRGESRQVWIRFDSRTAGWMAGTRRFRVVLHDEDSGHERVIPGSLQLWDFDLPSYDLLPNNSYALFQNSEFKSGELLARAVTEMKRYGLNTVFVHPSENPAATEVDDEGKIVKFDASAFEGRLRPILSAWKAAPGDESLRFGFSLSGGLSLGMTRRDMPYPGEKWRKVFAQWLARFKATVRGLGIADDAWVMAIADESDEAHLVGLEIPVAEMVKAIDPSIRLICNTSAVLGDRAESDRFFRAFDVLQPNLSTLKANPYLWPWMRTSGKTLWTYQCECDLGVRGRNTYEYYRVYDWEILKRGLTGIGVWSYCGNGFNPWEQPNWGCLLAFKAKDKNEVLHSRRYEFYREGLDDFRYVCALRQAAARAGTGAGKAAEALIRRAIDDITSHPTDTRRCETWRARMSEAILALDTRRARATAGAGLAVGLIARVPAARRYNDPNHSVP